MVVAIYDSDWFIKRLNHIEIDKTNALFWAVKSQFWPLSYNVRPQSVAPYTCLPCFKPLLTALVIVSLYNL
jgi:hypothetical protein